MPDTAKRRRIFVVVLAVCVAVAAVSVAVAAMGGGGSTPGAPRAPAADSDAAPRTEVPEHGALVFRSLDRDDATNYGHIAWAPLDHPDRKRAVGALGCERVHFAAGRGICLVKAGKLGTSLKARLLGRDLRPTAELKLPGVASRARISPDGRRATVTTFVSGHSYADVGAFSTQTTLIDARSGKAIADLEDFEVTNDGDEFESIDFNFWGVTFARDSDRFYATLASGGNTYLVEGDVAARRARVLRENVECPSLSPDGKRIVFKKLIEEPGIWRYHVLDLAGGRETPLAEKRPIDDQAEWLDDDHVLYRVDEETWVVPADGKGAPRRFLARADSPAVVR